MILGVRCFYLRRFLLLFCVGACSLSGPLRVDQKARGYRYDPPASSRWEPLQLEGQADEVWKSRTTDSFVALRSVCDRYDHVGLKSLMQNLVNSVQDAEVLEEELLRLDGREALRSKVQGRMDGVSVQAAFVILRKNDCIFDFTLTAARGAVTEEEDRDFLAFAKSFRYTGRAVQGDVQP